MSEKGWISIHRKITDNWIWNDKPFSKGQAWIDLLMMVNHMEKKILMDGKLVLVERGSRITSLRKLSDRWGWSVWKVKTFLELLQSDEMITFKTNTKQTVINIVNYSSYQSDELRQPNTDQTPTEHRPKTNQTPTKTNNNENKINNGNNDDDGILELQNFVSRFNKLTGLKVKSSSIQNLFLDIYRSKGSGVFDNALDAIEESDYLKKCYDVIWFLKNIDRVASGAYRNMSVERKTPCQNFKGQWSEMSVDEINRFAMEQTKRRSNLD